MHLLPPTWSAFGTIGISCASMCERAPPNMLLQGNGSPACGFYEERNAHCLGLAVYSGLSALKNTCYLWSTQCLPFVLCDFDTAHAPTILQETKKLPELAWRKCIMYSWLSLSNFARCNTDRRCMFVLRETCAEVAQKISNMEYLGNNASVREQLKPLLVIARWAKI